MRQSGMFPLLLEQKSLLSDAFCRYISETGLSSKAAQDLFLEKAGVATISGTSFGSNGEGFVRFSYANSNENILRAIDRIRQSLSL